jgi:hypothetical protein
MRRLSSRQIIVLILLGLGLCVALYVLWAAIYDLVLPSLLPPEWRGGWIWVGGAVGIALSVLCFCQTKRPANFNDKGQHKLVSDSSLIIERASVF